MRTTYYKTVTVRNRGMTIIMVVLFAILAAALFGVSAAVTYGTLETIKGVTITRNGERVCTGTDKGTECKYLEYTKDEVFENTDSLVFFKFNSSDVHNTIVAGKTCDLTVSGFRVPFLSMYRNILAADCR